VSISAEDHPKLIEEFRETMHSTNHQFIDLDLVKDIDNKRVTLTAVLRTLEEPDVSPLVDALAKIEGVKTINIH
jgi:hypothetical protein